MKKQKTAKTMLAALAATFAFSATAADVVPEQAKPAVAAEAKDAAPKAPVTLESALSFLPDVLAEIGEEKIMKAQLIKQLAQGQIAPELLAQLPQETVKGFLLHQLQEMVNDTVMLALAKKAGFEPSEKLVKDEMDKIYNQMSDGQKAKLETDLKKTYVAYRDETAANPDAQKYYACTAFLKSAVLDKAKDSVTDADAEKFYRENQSLFELPIVTVSHILVQVPEVGEDGKPLTQEALAEKEKAAKAKIDGIYARLKQGEKFEDLAEKESECPSGKRSRGKLPAFTRDGRMANGQMEATFTQAAIKLEKVGEISDVVKTPYGYHIIRLEEKKPQEYIPFDKVKDEIRARLTGEKIDGMIRAVLEQGRKDLGVKIFVSAEPAAPAAAEAAPAGSEAPAAGAAPAPAK